jgi:uncharacterized protein
MTLFGPSESDLATATERLQSHPEILAAYLHGSAAKGAMHPASDIDLALLLRPGCALPVMERLNLAADLELVFSRPVDLGLLSLTNVVYAAQVAAHGRRLFSRDVLQSDRFLAQALSEYAELQASRRPILTRYAA